MATDSARSTAPSAARQLWQVPVFLLGVAALIAVPLLRPHWTNDHASAAWQLHAARAALEQAPLDLPQAVSRGLRVIDSANRFPDLAAEAHFVVGSACLRLADEPGADSAGERRHARDHLEQAQTLTPGVAEADRPKLQYRLAKVWFWSGVEMSQVIAALEKSLESADDPGEGYGLLAQAYLRLTPPDHAKALEATKRQVDRLLASNDTRQQTQARLRLGELYFQLNKAKDARQTLARVTNDGSEQYFASRALLAESYEETQEWEQARGHWEQVRQNPRLSPAEKGRVLYRLGRSYAQEQRPKEAAAVWGEALGLGGDEAQAAALRLAELKLDAEARPAAVEALAAALGAMQGPDDYRNTVVPLDEAKKLIEKAAQLCRSKGEWDSALRAAELYGRLAPPGGGEVMLGLTADEWANALAEQALLAPPEQAAVLEDQKRAQLRAAGLAYEKAAAKAAAGPEQANWLNNSADRLMRANDLGRAIEVLTRYVQLEAVAPAEQAARAWFDLARANHHLQKFAAARAAYERCLTPDGPFLVQARLGMAKIDMAEGRFDDAERALEENKQMLLRASQPETALQEQTLFALAEAGYQRQAALKEELRDYGTTEQRLRAALEQYPDGPAALRARMMLALCHWNTASLKSQALDRARNGGIQLSDEDQKQYQRLQNENLQKAAELYAKVEEQLRAKDRLTAAETAALKQAAFWGTDCYFYMQKFDESVRRSGVLALQYKQRPEEMIALYHIWVCYTQYLHAPEKAAAVLTRMREALDKIPDAAFDGSLDTHRRAYWQDKLADAAKFASAPTVRD